MRLTKKQQELVTANLPLIRWAVGKYRQKMEAACRQWSSNGAWSNEAASRIAAIFCRAAATYDGRTKFSSYAIGGVWRALWSERRENQLRPCHAGLRSDDKAVNPWPEIDASIDFEIIIKYLPRAKDRRLLRDIFHRGLSVREVAEKHGVSKSAIQQRVKKALEILREKLRGQYVEPISAASECTSGSVRQGVRKAAKSQKIARGKRRVKAVSVRAAR